MKKRTWYGCYDPDGRMCVSADPDSTVQEKALRLGKHVDLYYAKEFRKWNVSGEGDEEYSDAVQDNSTIILCSDCSYENDFEQCKGYREKKKLKVIR